MFLVFQVVNISHSNFVSSQKLENTNDSTTETHPMASLRKRSAWSASPCCRPSGFFHLSDHGNFQRNPSHPQKISPGLYFFGPITYYKGKYWASQPLHCKWVILRFSWYMAPFKRYKLRFSSTSHTQKEAICWQPSEVLPIPLKLSSTTSAAHKEEFLPWKVAGP